MSEPIKTGDLVQVIRPCPYCGSNADVGVTFTALGVYVSNDPTDCCGETGAETIVEDGHHHGGGMLLQCCIRIPPLGELDDVKRDEEITA